MVRTRWRISNGLVIWLAFSWPLGALEGGGHDSKGCGISDIDEIRREVQSSPTTGENYRSRRAALGRWFRLLWHQGFDMSSFSETAGLIKSDSRLAVTALDKGYAILEEIQRNPKRIPEIKGIPGKAGSKTNWPMYLGTDGGNTGFSPDPGPASGEIVWRFPKHNSWDVRPVMTDDRIFVSAPGADVVCYCREKGTGKVLWRARQHGFDLYNTRGSSLEPVVTRDRVMIRIGGVGCRNLLVDRGTGRPIEIPVTGSEGGSGDGPKFMAYLLNGWVCVADGRTGRDLWKKKLPAEPAGVPEIMGGKMYAATRDGTVSRIDMSTRETDWNRVLPVRIRGRVTVEKGRVCVETEDGRLHCLNWVDGKPLWSWRCPEREDRALQFFSPPRVADKRIYVGGASGCLYCLDASTGALVWKYETGSWIRSRPLVIGDMVYAATLDSDLHAIRDGGNEGQRQWQAEVGAHGFTADLVGDQSRILLSGRDLILYSVEPMTGKVQWRHGIIDGAWIEGEFFASGWMTGFMTTPAVVDDVMYIGGPDGFVNAVDVETGEEKWRFELGGVSSAVPVVAEGKVFIGRETGGGSRFCALDKDTGKPVWESEAFGLTWVAPAYRKGMLFFGNRAGDMFGVDARNGEIVWSYDLAKDTPLEDRPRDDRGHHGWPPGVFSNPAIDEKNVYVGSWIGYYFAFEQRRGGLRWRTKTMPENEDGGRPDSAAPMLHKNHLYVQKAGRSIAALHKDTGELKWEWEAPRGFLQNGTVAAHGDKIFGSFVRGVTTLPYHATIVAFSDVESGGEKLWEYDGGGGLTAPVVTGDKVIFGSSADMFVTCLRPDTGAVLWRTFTGGEMRENVPALYGGKVFVQCNNGWVFAIE